MSFFVYKITNLINNKIYIGKTNDIENRWQSHQSSAKKKCYSDHRHLYNAMNKYRFENFKIECIGEYFTEKESLDAEIYFIAEFKSRDRSIGYNLTDGGDGSSGYKHTEESKKLMSKMKEGVFLGEGNPFYGKHHSDEMKLKHSKVMKEQYNENIEKYNKLNLAQCKLTTEQCIEIQKLYLTTEYSFEDLVDMYDVNLSIMNSIIHGSYFPIREKSIINEQKLKEIYSIRRERQARKYDKFSNEEELQIINDYNTGKFTFYQLAQIYKCSNPTIAKIFPKHNIKITKGPRPKINSEPSKLQEVEKQGE